MFKKLAIKAGLWNEPSSEVPPSAEHTVSAGSAVPPPAISVPLQAVPNQAANPELVRDLKKQGIASSPILNEFLEKMALVGAKFPNDPVSATNAVLAFMQLEAKDLLETLDRTVSATLTQAKREAERERDQKRSEAVGGLENQVRSLEETIRTAEAQIVELQQKISDGRTRIAALQQDIRVAETNIVKRNAEVDSSFAEAERYFAGLRQTLQQSH